VWDLVKFSVDELNAKGQFILCGSSAPTFDANRHSGAMRIGKITMMPMTADEMLETTREVSFISLFSKDYMVLGEKKFPRTKYLNLIVRGG
jgi:hypothetical protein